MSVTIVAYPSDNAFANASVGDGLELFPVGTQVFESGGNLRLALRNLELETTERLAALGRSPASYTSTGGRVVFGVSIKGDAGYGSTLVSRPPIELEEAAETTVNRLQSGLSARPEGVSEIVMQRQRPVTSPDGLAASVSLDISAPSTQGMYQACYDNGYSNALVRKTTSTKTPYSTIAFAKTQDGAEVTVTLEDSSKSWFEVSLKLDGVASASGVFTQTSFQSVSSESTVGPNSYKRFRGKWLWYRWQLECWSDLSETWEVLGGYSEWRPDSWSGENEPFNAWQWNWNFTCDSQWKIHAPTSLKVQRSTVTTVLGDITTFGSSIGVKSGYEETVATTIEYKELSGTRGLCGDGAFPATAGKTRSSLPPS